MNTSGIIGLAVLAAVLAACGCVPAAGVEVYRSDGSRQCEQASGISPEAMRPLLTGIRVLAQRRDVLRTMAFPAVCGGATGHVNVYTVAAGDVDAALARGFTLWSASRPSRLTPP